MHNNIIVYQHIHRVSSRSLICKEHQKQGKSQAYHSQGS